MAKPKVFVSHSHKDDSFTTLLVTHLNMLGAKAWMDSNDLGAGNFLEHIDEALTDCEWFLCVLTSNVIDSKPVRDEVYAAIRLKHLGRIREIIFVKAGEVDYRDLPPSWAVLNVFDAVDNYVVSLQQVLKQVGLSQTSTAIADLLVAYPPPSETPETPTVVSTEAAKPVLRILPTPGGMSASDAEQLQLAEADLSEARRLATELADRLHMFSIHTGHTNYYDDNVEIPDSLEMAVDLADLVHDYVADPYAQLCECHSPLMDEKCPICGKRMCIGGGLYQSAPLSFGRDCGRTAATWQVKGSDGSFAEVCSRHTYEEVSAHGLDYCEYDDTF